MGAVHCGLWSALRAGKTVSVSQKMFSAARPIDEQDGFFQSRYLANERNLTDSAITNQGSADNSAPRMTATGARQHVSAQEIVLA